MSSNTEQLLKEHSRSLRLIEKNLCCAIATVEMCAGNHTFIKGLFEMGVDHMPELLIDEDTKGTYTSITDDGASGSITIDYTPFGGIATGDLPFSSPLVLSIGDKITVKRTVTTFAGWFKISGTY